MRLTRNAQQPPQRQDQWFGKLYPDEVALAKTVFADTLPYDLIYISNVGSGTGAITVATSPVKHRAEHLILWAGAWQVNVATQGEEMRATFIHELTHVWQSRYGNYAMSYMADSAWAQLKEGTKDIFKDGYKKGLERIKEMIKKGVVQPWNEHRAHAYSFTMNDVGKSWSDFNVEQQASLVESWFSSQETRFAGNVVVPPGYRSPKDARYPYIKDNILAKSTAANYVGVQNQAGYSAELAEIQAKLYALGYLKDAKYVDGYSGGVTRNAVVEFQKRNGLKPDGDLGTPRSLTRRKLNQPLNQLVRMP